LTVKISCVAEALAEKVIRSELREKDARHIGRQIMRENTLELFPQRKEQVSHEATSVR